MKRISSSVFDPCVTTDSVIVNNDQIAHEFITSDVFPLILSILNNKDIQSAVCVKKSWNVKVIEIFKNKEYSLKLELLTYFSSKIDSSLYKSQIDELSSMKSDQKILNCIHLPGIKSSNEDTIKKILNIIKTLQLEDLEKLETLVAENLESSNEAIKLRTPPGLKKLCEVAKIYNEIDSNIKLRTIHKENPFHEHNYNTIISNLCFNLTKIGFNKESLKIAEKELEPFFIHHICFLLLDEELDDRAIEFAEISSNFKEARYLSVRILNHHFDKIIEMKKTNSGVEILRKTITHQNK